MKRFWLALFAILVAAPAWAQVPQTVRICNGTQPNCPLIGSANPLPVTVSGGGGGGLSVQDNTAFTYGTSPFTPGGGFYNSTITPITSGNQGAFALTANRDLHVDAVAGTNLASLISAPVPCKAAATWNAQTGQTGTQPAACDGSNALWMDWGALNGVALGSPSNYGTSPGTVPVQGVNAFITNPVATTAPVNQTPTNCSGAITTGGTAQNAFTAQTTLHGFIIANIDTGHNAEVLWTSFTTTAAPLTAASYPLPAPTATTFAGFGSFSSPAGFGTNVAVSIIGATSGHIYSCTWW